MGMLSFNSLTDSHLFMYEPSPIVIPTITFNSLTDSHLVSWCRIDQLSDCIFQFPNVFSQRFSNCSIAITLYLYTFNSLTDSHCNTNPNNKQPTNNASFNSLTDSHYAILLHKYQYFSSTFNSLTDSHWVLLILRQIIRGIHNFQFPNGFSLM